MQSKNQYIKKIFRFKLLVSGMLPIAIGTIFGLGSCKKFVQVDPPITQLATGSLFKSNEAATSAQMAIYIQIYSGSESFRMTQYCGLLSDELTNYANTGTTSVIQQIQYYTNSMVASASPYNGCWQNAYKYIYEANSIIENLQNNVNITPAVAQQLTGESKFLRAFWYFYLTNQYGDVPVTTTTDYRINGSLSRAPRVQVYRQIITDLKDAQNLLSASYLDITNTAVTTERVRPNKAAAQALLARAYLYTNKYDSAEAMATSVITNSNYSLCPNLSGPNSVFLKNSNEAIWQLQTTLPANYNTNDGNSFILTGAPNSGGGNQSTTISPQLLGAFEAGDNRKTSWIKATTTSPPYNYPFKYQVGALSPQATNLGSITEYTMVLRLAEQYLVRAEARAQQGNLGDAINDLNAIRNRAGLPSLSNSLDQSQVLAAVLHERQVELFCEWGYRWYDLVRTGSAATVLGSPGNVYNAKGGLGAWDNTKQLFPVPLPEITNDPNLTQNPAY